MQCTLAVLLNASLSVDIVVVSCNMSASAVMTSCQAYLKTVKLSLDRMLCLLFLCHAFVIVCDTRF